MARSFEDLVDEAARAPVDGWDFSWLDGRATEQRPSWGYQRLLGRHLAGASAALDIQTGGGEVLAGARGAGFPPTMVATEGWAPNVARAAARLHPLGAVVVSDPEEPPLPFADGAFDLVSSRHPATVHWAEIARVLAPGGTYLAQHVGGGANVEISEHLLGPLDVGRARDHEVEAAQARAAGLDVVECRNERLPLAFFDVGAVVYFLRKVVWTVPGFTVDRHLDRLRDIHEQIEQEGVFRSTTSRTLFVARRPQRPPGPTSTRLASGHGGGEVWRSERGIHRTAGPWTPTVHAFLDHLAAAGFDGSPRVVGSDEEGREVLTFLDGEVLADPAWRPGDLGPWPQWARSDAAVTAAGSLLRRLHDAASGFRPVQAVWRRHDHAELLPDEIVGHGDVGRHNAVYREGVPVAFIDWDTIRPTHPLVEMGAAAWKFVPLGTDAAFAASEWPARPDLPRRLALFAEAYGVTDPEAVRWALQQGRQRSAEQLRHLAVDPADAAHALRVVATDLAWLATAQDDLLAPLRHEA